MKGRASRRSAGTALPSSRSLALDLLDAVLASGQSLTEALERHPHAARLDRRDIGHARLLTMTVLRRLGSLDREIDRFLREPPRSVRLKNILRLGAAQLFLLETSPHAAVNETVGLAQGTLSGMRGLVNAVMRKLAAVDPARVEEGEFVDLPAWLTTSWVEAHGRDTTRRICETLRGEPPLDLQVRGDLETFAEALGAEPVWGHCLRRPTTGSIEDLPGFSQGAWWVQDLAASLPVHLLDPACGDRVLDLCAAPGGKTMQLAARGAKVTAVDSDQGRLAWIAANLKRTRLEAALVHADAREWHAGEPFPYVLLDAPCTATGTIRRHPDIPWLKRATDAITLQALQKELLTAALAMLAPGGICVYAVCSLQAEEAWPVVDHALGLEPSIHIEPIAAEELEGLPLLADARGGLRTLPCDLAAKGGMDGFFIVRLKRGT